MDLEMVLGHGEAQEGLPLGGGALPPPGTWDHSQIKEGIKIKIFDPGGGPGRPKNMSFWPSNFLVLACRAYFGQKLILFGLPGLWDYQKRNLGEILPGWTDAQLWRLILTPVRRTQNLVSFVGQFPSYSTFDLL